MIDYRNIITTPIQYRNCGKVVPAQALGLRIIERGDSIIEYWVKILINGELKRISPACLVNRNQFRKEFKEMECGI